MQNKEKFIVKLLLQKIGLKDEVSIQLLKVFVDRKIGYKTITDRLLDIEEINKYLTINNYKEESINIIISEMLKRNVKVSKIIQMDKVFEKHNYTMNERQKIIITQSTISNKSVDSINNKLSFYDDFNIKEYILIYPSRISYPISFLYARINYLKDVNKYEKYKELIFSKRFTFEDRFGVKDEELVEKYPLPKKYITAKEKKIKYIPKEIMVLNILFKGMGLTTKETQDLINKLESREISYEQIKRSKDKIKDLIIYFKDSNYNQQNINTIVADTTTKKSVDKVKETDVVLINNDYSNKQREKIETHNKIIFNQNAEVLDIKIKFLKNEHIPKERILKSRVITQSFKLTYARIKFLKTMGKEPLAYYDLLFREEDRFKTRFGVTSNNLLEKFPVTEEKYKVKVKK